MNIKKMYNDACKYFENFNMNEFINIQSEENQGNIEIENKEIDVEKVNDENNQEKEQVQENNKVSEDEQSKEEWIEEQIDENNQEQTQEQINDNNVEENNISEEQSNNNKSGGVGGADEEVNINSDEQISQMEVDANFVKNNIEMIVPVNGTVTSRFGTRTPTDIISANHAGIDIGAYEGTKIIAAMAGKVTHVSSEGDYGNHIKIENGGVSTIYAHCKTIYVKEGDEVKKVTEIAEVGSTGRATRASFTF